VEFSKRTARTANEAMSLIWLMNIGLRVFLASSILLAFDLSLILFIWWNDRKERRAEEMRRKGKMNRYEVIIYWSAKDKAFIAEAPELAGCMADGKTYQEALANLEVVMQEWIETARKLGRSIPEPKGRLVFA
jgi:predicted RNase H-like HicB family nuclease